MDSISQSNFDLFKAAGLIVNATGGGLILARPHSENGAGMMRWNRGKIEVFGQIEGWEFLINPYAAKKYDRRINEINNDAINSREKFEEYELPAGTKIIDLMPIMASYLKQSKFLYLSDDNYFIVNKHSTKKYLHELNQINLYGQ